MTTQPRATKATAPKGLGRAGRRLWNEITKAYKLRPDEVRVLGDACREADLIERLEDELVDAPLMVKGSMGQLVASPLVSEVRQHRSTLSSLLKSLKLPDTDAAGERAESDASAQARAAARARWDRKQAQ